MNLKAVIDFFKKQNLYNEQYFKKIEANTKIYDRSYEEIKELVGCFPIYDNENNIIDVKLILPKIKNIYDVLIYVHEYTHALFIEDENEIFPNIMEAIFINKYCDEQTKAEIIEKTKTEILKETDENHIVGKKVKIMSIKKSF